MSAVTLTILVNMDASADRAGLDRTLRSIGRSRHALRRLKCSARLLIVTTESTGDSDQWAQSAARIPVSFVTDPRAAVLQGLAPDAPIAVCDAGEILDPDFLASALRALQGYGSRAVVHSEHILIAGSEPILLRTPDTRRGAPSFEALLDSDPWPGCEVTTAAVLAEFERDATASSASGHLWRLETIAAGVPQLTVAAINVLPSDQWEAQARAVLPIDTARLEAGLDLLRRSSASRSAAVAAWERDHPVASGPIRIVRRGRRRLRRLVPVLRLKLRQRRSYRQALRHLREVGHSDAIAPTATISTRHGDTRGDGYARLLMHAWVSLARAADILLVTPQVSTRSSDRVALHYARVLAGDAADKRRAVLLTCGSPERTESGLIPVEVSHYPISAEFARLTADRQVRLIAQLGVLLHAQHVLAVDAPFSAVMVGRSLPSSADTRMWVHVSSSRFFADEPISASSTVTVIAEGPAAAEHASARLGVDAGRVRIHVPPALPVTPDFDTVTQYTAAYDDDEFDEEHPFRVLWRTSDEDDAGRSALLDRILALVSERRLPIRLHGHHEAGSVRAGTRPPRSADPHFEDDGEFTGGLLDVPSENYHLLLLDPGIVDARAFTVQAMLLGLPVLAVQPADDDLILHDVTGLVARDAMPASLVSSIETLSNSRDTRRRLIRAAHDRAKGLNDAVRFSEVVRRDLAAHPAEEHVETAD